MSCVNWMPEIFYDRKKLIFIFLIYCIRENVNNLENLIQARENLLC